MARKDRRIWTIIVVPPDSGGTTRHIRLTSRGISIVLGLIVTVFGGTLTWTGETTSYAALTATQLAASQQTVMTLLDSVQRLQVLADVASRLPPRHMVMPIAGRITSGFSGARLHPILSVLRAHRGVDVAAPSGTPIVAAAAGRVRVVERRLGYGLTVEVEHSGGVVTRYAHCRTATVSVGQLVAAGANIATAGSSGLATGPHLHFEVITGGVSVDPIKFLAASRKSGIEQAGQVGPDGGQ
jgi:murein DD-endopeptidase MepM/ murein hydrolase activator NlpD